MNATHQLRKSFKSISNIFFIYPLPGLLVTEARISTVG